MTVSYTQEETRQDALKRWLRETRTTTVGIAKRMRVSKMQVYNWLYYSPSIPPKRHKRLVDIGLPSDLLPPAVYIPPGPKPGTIKNKFSQHSF